MRHERRYIRADASPNGRVQWLCYCIGCHWYEIGDAIWVNNKWRTHLEDMIGLGEVK